MNWCGQRANGRTRGRGLPVLGHCAAPNRQISWAPRLVVSVRRSLLAGLGWLVARRDGTWKALRPHQIHVLLVHPDRKDERRWFGSLTGMRPWIGATGVGVAMLPGFSRAPHSSSDSLVNVENSPRPPARCQDSATSSDLGLYAARGVLSQGRPYGGGR